MAPDPDHDQTAHAGEIDVAGYEEQRDRIEDLEEIVAFLVHELRNPLAVVKGFARALEDATERMDENMMRASANAITRNSEHLSSLVDSLADVYSLTTDKMKLNLSETLLSELVHETVTDLTPLMNGNPVELRIEDDAYAMVDRIRIRQALTNLLTNAVKYGPDGKPVEISVTREGSGVHISVADAGAGIPAAKVDRLFKKFSRLDRKGNGMGIGLFISHGIARAHGGDLFLADAERGCRFVLMLPATDLRGAAES